MEQDIRQKNKRNIIILSGLFLALAVGFYFYMSYSIDAKIEADTKHTMALPQKVKELINYKNARKINETEIAEQQAPGFKKYIYLTNGHISGEGTDLAYVVNSEINEKLNTLGNISSDDLDGVVLSDNHFETVGYYVKDDMLGDLFSAITNEEKKEQRTGTEARRICRVLTYVSLPSEQVVRRDSVWGGNPPTRLRGTDSSLGSFPDDDEIVATIQKAMQ